MLIFLFSLLCRFIWKQMERKNLSQVTGKNSKQYNLSKYLLKSLGNPNTIFLAHLGVFNYLLFTVTNLSFWFWWNAFDNQSNLCITYLISQLRVAFDNQSNLCITYLISQLRVMLVQISIVRLEGTWLTCFTWSMTFAGWVIICFICFFIFYEITF